MGLSSDHPLAQDLEHVLGRTGTLWEELRGSRIFITGASGFIGTWLLESFLWANDSLRLGAEAVALTRDPAGFRTRAPRLTSHPALALIEGNQVDFKFPSGGFDTVLHTAVEYALPLETFERNLMGTRRILAFAEQTGVRRLLFTSSGAVYGPQPVERERLSEDYTGSPRLEDPANAYGLSKRAAEHLGHLHGDVGFKIARCFAFIGPHLPLNRSGAMGNFLADALGGGPIRVSGDGTPLRSYLYAADLAIWLWTILIKGVSGRAYNVGGEEAISIRDLAKRVASVLAPRAEVHMAMEPNSGLSARYIPDLTRSKRELGLEPWIPLDEGIRRTGRWLNHSS